LIVVDVVLLVMREEQRELQKEADKALKLEQKEKEQQAEANGGDGADDDDDADNKNDNKPDEQQQQPKPKPVQLNDEQRQAAADYTAFATRHLLLRPDATLEREKFVDLYLPTRASLPDAARRTRVLRNLVDADTSIVGAEAHDSDDDVAQLALAGDLAADDVPPRAMKRRRAFHYATRPDTKQRVVVVLDAANGRAEYTQATQQINLRPVTQMSYGRLFTFVVVVVVANIV
jgi:hypothetical protein